MKETLLRRVLNLSQQELANAQKGFKSASREAAEAEGAMQSRYSTFKEEAQYLASGYARRMNEINAVIENIEAMLARPLQTCMRVCIGALVQIENLVTKERETYFLVKNGGGLTLRDTESGNDIVVVSITAPIGQQLNRKKVGDTVELFHTREKWVLTHIA